MKNISFKETNTERKNILILVFGLMAIAGILAIIFTENKILHLLAIIGFLGQAIINLKKLVINDSVQYSKKVIGINLNSKSILSGKYFKFDRIKKLSVVTNDFKIKTYEKTYYFNISEYKNSDIEKLKNIIEENSPNLGS
jgi:hypothetical protein